MRTKVFRKAICLLLMLVLVLALALTANAAGILRDPEDPQQPGQDPALTIAYKNLSYSSDIYVLYAVSYQNVEHPEQITMLFWDAPQDSYEKGTEAYSAESRRAELILGVSHEIFYSNGVAPKELIENQYCRAYIRIDGVDYYSEVIKYNPLKYVKSVAEGATTTDADRNLVNALIAYGAAAQIRFNYETSDLATDTHYEITLQTAHLADGFGYGLYKAGTELTLTAEIPTGDSVARWIDGNGVITGSEGQASITYTLNADSAVRAVLASEPDSCDHVYSAWIPAADASCTEAGAVGHYHCDLCGRNFDAQYAVISDPVVIPALGHEWVDVAAVPATCVDGHTAYRYCSRCGEEEGNTVLPATEPHDYVETVVAPSGEARGYTDHVCSVCGDSYKTDYDYSLYSGVNFVDEGKFPINYNFDSSVYTIEVSVKLPATYSNSNRGGVLVGNYDGSARGFNLEVYTNGKLRLYFVANAAGTGTKTNYDYIFNTDIRSDSVKNLAVVIADGSAVLYVDGVLTETKALDDFVMPEIGRTLVLGGDNRNGNSQGFKGTIYSATIYRDVRTEEEIVSDLVLADATDQNCCVSYNLLDSTGLTGAVTLDNILDNAQVTTAEELAYHAGHGTRNIEVMNDITIDRTIYVISDVTIFSNSNYTLLRDPDFYSDMFVVGENAAGRNLILDNIACVLNLGKAGASGTLTVDGNKANVTGDVYGSLVYINNSGVLNLRDGAVLTNNKKVANSRSLGMEQYYANMVGGAAILNINGTVNMAGGVISYNEVNATDPGSGDTTNEHYLESCYGGAVFNNSNFVMTGGTINDNYGYYGGAISNFQECTLEGGLVEANHTTHAGGAIYMLNNYMRTLTIGKENAAADSIIFRGNYVQGSNGGAVYSGSAGSVLLLGGATFDGNYATGSAGAIYVGSLGQMEGNNRFVNNHAGGIGGAIYLTAPTTDRRSITIEDATFSGNYANAGGAIAIVGADVTLTDCAFSGNEARSSSGGAIYVNRLTDGNVGADVAITGGSFSQNSANTEGGAIFGDLNCDISVTGTGFTENTSVTTGGAIAVHGAENLALTGVTATENVAGTSGGAFYVSYRTVTDNSDPENPVSTAVDSTATITNCTLTDNTADDLGGAITAYAGNSGASFFTMSGTSISGSTAGNHGGALCLYTGAATLNNNTFSGNTTAKNGGAIYGGAATVTGNGNTFTNNTSNNSQLGGGAIYTTGSAVTLSGSTFTGNSTTANGGAVAAFSSSTVTLTDTVAQSNTAGNYGGFACAYNSTLTLNSTSGHRNTIGSLSDDTKGNSAGAGGAIYADVNSTVNVANADIGYNSSVNSGGALYYNTAGGTVSGCTISHNSNGSAGADAYGGAMLVGYGSNVTVTGSSFSENTSTRWGGAIYLRRKDASDPNPSVPSSLTLTNTSFNSNSGSNGGAIYANLECTVTGSGCTFTTNRATEAGGAIYAASDTVVTLSGATLRQNTAGTTGGAIMVYTGATLTTTNDTLFDQNSSTGIGGAIYFNSANGSLTDTDFTGNSVGANGWYGGAIYTNGTSELYATRCEFTDNENLTGGGGAVCCRGTGVMEITDSSFTGNRAKTYGGAVWVFGTVTATITDSDFTGNSITSTSTTVNNGNYAAEGGAIMVGYATGDGSSLTISGGTFSQNSGVTGGAIGVKSGTALTVNSSTVGGTAFSENTAAGGGGGAIFAEANATVTLSDATFDQNSTTGSGGAIYAKEGVAATITDTDFTSNTSGNGGALILFGANATVSGGEFTGNNGGSGYGGAIYLRQGGSSETGTLEVTAAEFNTNVAATGAAIYVNANSTLTATNATFTGNGSATDTNDGGAIFVNGTGSIDLTGGSFTSNTAKNSGGAIYLNTTATAALDSVAFTGNTCGLYGGAMYMNGTSQATVTDCTFTQNTNPTSYGGAIQIRGTAPVLTISGSTFDRNSAKYGGAIGSFETVTMTISDSVFTQNTAATNAGAIMAGRAVTNNVTSNVTLSLDGCSFTQNTVTNGSGGAVYLYGTGSLNANDTDFISNTSSATGGAIYAYLDGSSENATLTGCALTSNSAGGNGGAIYLSAGSKMSWTNVSVTGNSSSGNGNAVYVTNGSGKTTLLNIVSAAFDQSGPCIFIGNSGTSVVVHKPGITDVNHSPVDYTLIITGSSNYATTKVTYEEN